MLDPTRSIVALIRAYVASSIIGTLGRWWWTLRNNVMFLLFEAALLAKPTLRRIMLIVRWDSSVSFLVGFLVESMWTLRSENSILSVAWMFVPLLTMRSAGTWISSARVLARCRGRSLLEGRVLCVRLV